MTILSIVSGGVIYVEALGVVSWIASCGGRGGPVEMKFGSFRQD